MGFRFEFGQRLLLLPHFIAVYRLRYVLVQALQLGKGHFFNVDVWHANFPRFFLYIFIHELLTLINGGMKYKKNLD